ncbi:MAG TPA: hypothetical protein VHO25_12760 [Polyangiaceae bacterium]|nr:hypothetical protein [Polyangiaceae bacterium]
MGRRLIDWLVLGFAAYAFAFVPLGEHTALEHVKAILSTEDSARAGRELKHAGEKLAHKLLEPKGLDPADTQPLPAKGKPEMPQIAPANLATATNDALICDVADPR